MRGWRRRALLSARPAIASHGPIGADTAAGIAVRRKTRQAVVGGLGPRGGVFIGAIKGRLFIQVPRFPRRASAGDGRQVGAVAASNPEVIRVDVIQGIVGVLVEKSEMQVRVAAGLDVANDQLADELSPFDFLPLPDRDAPPLLLEDRRVRGLGFEVADDVPVLVHLQHHDERGRVGAGNALDNPLDPGVGRGDDGHLADRG